MAMKEIEGTPMSGRDTLDKVILHLLRSDIYPKINMNRGQAIQVGVFAFRSSSHSTGCSVQIWIVLPEKEPREILSTTYWYTSNYTFNRRYVEKGSWDKRLQEVKSEMYWAMVEDVGVKTLASRKAQEVKISEEESERTSFEKEFLAATS